MSAILRWSCIAVILSCCAFCIPAQGCNMNRYTYDSNCDGYCHCSILNACNSDNGGCMSGGCALNYTLQPNKTCQPVCGWNRFGDDCQGRCHCRVPSACNLYTGKCLSGGCETGYTVDTNGTCQPACGSNRFGVSCQGYCHCSIPSACNNENGVCTSGGCEAGYQLDTNIMCQTACESNRFGVNCQGYCHCSIPSACNKVSGVCTSGVCEAGYELDANRMCKPQACGSNRFGVNCQGYCHCSIPSACNKNGVCTSGGCEAGYQLDTNMMCQTACGSSRFGVNCQGYCHCSIPSACNKVSGVCTSWRCEAGYQLDANRMCQTPCGSNRFGVNCQGYCHCSIPSACNKVSGVCTSGVCEAGYQLDANRMCEPQACGSNRFGVNCQGYCHCSIPSACNNENGVCTSGGCEAGYQLDTNMMCQTPCGSNRFGVNCQGYCHCSIPSACNMVSGVCTSGVCEAGYQLDSNRMCKPQACGSNRFGVNCQGYCHCSVPSACNNENGVCTSGGCEAGYLLDTNMVCQTHTPTECKDKEFGNPCKSCMCKDIEEVCNKTTGVCTSGAQNITQPLAAPIGGGVAGLLVIILLVVVIVLILRRRKSQKQAGLEIEDNSRIIDKTDHQNVAYEGTSNAIYANEMETFSLSPIVISIPNLLKYVQNKLQLPDTLESEFKSIPGGLRGSTDIATQPENISKCRYKGILPYDHSRVVLVPRDSNPSDFINASYINGFVKPKEYIASQGPMNKVPGVTDFWNMAWQQNSDIIVMLTRLREAARNKCEQYWPNEGSQVYGYITVELLATHEFDDFCVRTLQAQAEGKVRTLKMFHFKEWGDHDAPRDTTGIILLREKIHEAKDEARGPIIVHCSAGVGRTGTFIAFDILMKRAQLEGAVDIRQCIHDIRNERGKMVQTKAQYTFLHSVLCDAWYCGGSTFTPMEFTETYDTILRSLGRSGKSRVQREFETLEQLKKERKNTDYSVAHESRNVTKNRDTAALPPDSERLFLSTTVPERTDYINAVYLPGYMNKNAYISTQLPVSDTVVDFWRLVYEQHSTTIIMLNEADNLTKAFGVYWPSDDEKIDVGPFEIRHQGNIQDGGTFQRQFGLLYKKRAHEPVRTVRQMCVRSWPDGQNVPSSMNVLVDLFKSTQEWQRQHQNRPVIVHCMNGVDKTALVCTAWAILEKLKSEQVISVMLTVKQMRNKRPTAIHNLEQYRFCYELAKHYLEEFDTYANFQ